MAISRPVCFVCTVSGRCGRVQCSARAQRSRRGRRDERVRVVAALPSVVAVLRWCSVALCWRSIARSLVRSRMCVCSAVQLRCSAVQCAGREWAAGREGRDQTAADAVARVTRTHTHTAAASAPPWKQAAQREHTSVRCVWMTQGQGEGENSESCPSCVALWPRVARRHSFIRCVGPLHIPSSARKTDGWMDGIVTSATRHCSDC